MFLTIRGRRTGELRRTASRQRGAVRRRGVATRPFSDRFGPPAAGIKNGRPEGRPREKRRVEL
jgi:hypothetical protein